MKSIGRLAVLYGSQTYTAQEIAEKIWRTTKALGFSGPVEAMDEYDISKLIHEQFVLFVCATTGQGDEPDNMQSFWKFLLKKSLPSNSLIRLKFGVLGLGDSSYAKFNFVSKKLHKRLLQLGATPLLDIGLCDYQHDLGHDAVIIPWLEQFYKSLKVYLPDIKSDHLIDKFIPRWKLSLLKDSNKLKQNNSNSEDIYFRNGQKAKFCVAKLFKVTLNEKTTSDVHFQDVRLITLNITDENKLSYDPGDIFNIRARNSKEDIDDLFGIFEQHGMDIKPHYRLFVEEYHDVPNGMFTVITANEHHYHFRCTGYACTLYNFNLY